jgi:hypothetical protein
MPLKTVRTSMFEQGLPAVRVAAADFKVLGRYAVADRAQASSMLRV